ncbi:MAG TPA: hypothetical protein VG013_15695 [Gemmataceae bacterium]|nr:hypothetical protein [Gemmataceae bacterium]
MGEDGLDLRPGQDHRQAAPAFGPDDAPELLEAYPEGLVIPEEQGALGLIRGRGADVDVRPANRVAPRA